ncbi:hypothetical protein SSAG_01208 [Streptomyces sp. Mg1]|nr:hypothetical protein SSAG_01208 [Streptomyces sp. Mg1]
MPMDERSRAGLDPVARPRPGARLSTADRCCSAFRRNPRRSPRTFPGGGRSGA